MRTRGSLNRGDPQQQSPSTEAQEDAPTPCFPQIPASPSHSTKPPWSQTRQQRFLPLGRPLKAKKTTRELELGEELQRAGAKVKPKPCTHQSCAEMSLSVQLQSAESQDTGQSYRADTTRAQDRKMISPPFPAAVHTRLTQTARVWVPYHLP